MTHKREGMCIGGPWAGSFRSAMSDRLEYQIQQEPLETKMFKIGAYVHHDINIGGAQVTFWAPQFMPLIDVVKELMEGYWRYQDVSK